LWGEGGNPDVKCSAIPPTLSLPHKGGGDRVALASPMFPSPLWGGVRGGGNPYIQCSAIPPSLSLPHKGGGDAHS